MEVVADTFCRMATMADAIHLTRGLASDTGGIDRGSQMACTTHGSFQIVTHFVHAHYKDDMFRSPGDGGHAITRTVDVDDQSIFRDGIGTGQVIVAREGLAVDLHLLGLGLDLVPIEHLIVASFEGSRQSHLPDGQRASPRDTAPFGNQFLNLFDRIGRIGTIIGIDVATFHLLDDNLGQSFISDRLNIHVVYPFLFSYYSFICQDDIHRLVEGLCRNVRQQLEVETDTHFGRLNRAQQPVIETSTSPQTVALSVESDSRHQEQIDLFRLDDPASRFGFPNAEGSPFHTLRTLILQQQQVVPLYQGECQLFALVPTIQDGNRLHLIRQGVIE